MRLSRLELHGFKSFADSTTMSFDSGVTAVVGPNGCGKSNVSDAVRWVLGEQRARLLRGAKMEEVIFQGSSARRPVNVAEVSLHFENEDGSLPLPFKEVAITRRLSRSGESEYFLNRVPCRLKDISDMLRGTGLGTDTGVVIESKMIDALLSDRPDDRRELFEEAAGIGLYRDRRRITERRLAETSVDLQRLDDLVSEVQTQVRSLARQRKRAERYAELAERRFTVEVRLAAREIEVWQGELERLEARVVALREDQPSVEHAVTAAEAARDVAHGGRTAAEAHRAEFLRLVTLQRDEVQRIRSEKAVVEERQRNAIAQRRRAESEATEGAAYRTRIVVDRQEAAAERARLNQELTASREAFASRQREEDAVRTAAARARLAVEDTERRHRELDDRARQVQLDLERARRELDEVGGRATVLDGERVQLADAAALLRREREDAAGYADEAQGRLAAAQRELEEARSVDRVLRTRESAARAELFRADESYTNLQSKVSALETLERERVGLAPAAARLLADRKSFEDGAILGPLSDFISADQGSALLVERFLGPTIHAVLVRDRATASKVQAWHAATNPGPLLLLPLDAAGEHPPGDIAPDALAHLVGVSGPATAWVHSLLGGGRALDAGSAFVDARGAVWLPGTVGGPGPLRRRAELYALRSELASADVDRQTAAGRADQLRESLERCESRAREASEANDASQQDVRRTANHLMELERRGERASRELHEAETLADRLSGRRDELTARLVAVDAEASALASQLLAHDAVVRQARESFHAAERAQDDARDRRTQAQIAEAQADAQLQVAADRDRHLAEEVASAVARLDSLHAELTGLTQADTALADQVARWQLDLETREATLVDGEARLAEAEHAVLGADDALRRADHSLDEARHRATSVSDELHHAELRFTELSGRRTSIRERLEAEWRRPLEEMLLAVSPIDIDDVSLRAEVDTIRQQLDVLGPVNVLAVEEHEEVLKRFDFLTAQRRDLGDARASLQLAIREIDATARDLFLATFDHVRKNFLQIFMTLFGGGECDLRLENPDAPLDCDIEIHASPRGKRSQRIHLLSSGERALVALSLLFGIFLTKPSPFCLLDEVDAPLDDANVGRFVRMLNQFKTRTQFIVITHNPRTTTEAADAVYGVTMQEPGVSSLVSVRMRGEHIDERRGEAVAEPTAAA